jgi:hypothetical protein
MESDEDRETLQLVFCERPTNVTMATLRDCVVVTAPVATAPSEPTSNATTAEVPASGATTPRTSPTGSVVVDVPSADNSKNMSGE